MYLNIIYIMCMHACQGQRHDSIVSAKKMSNRSMPGDKFEDIKALKVENLTHRQIPQGNGLVQ